jgi:hypothetical protein
MEWAYIQIASLVFLVALIAYVGLADARLRREQ